MRLAHARGAGHRPAVLAIDGRSSGGKTTLAGRLQGVVAGSAVVHTDDIAWWYSRFGWAELLVNEILIPVRAGRPVSFRPPPWDERERPGAIKVPAGCPLLIVEGVGAARSESAHLTDGVIWVQSDEQETERRNLARVGQSDGMPTEQDHREWMAEEMPFQARQRPWERADLIVCGTPQVPFDPATEIVVAPPLNRSSRLPRTAGSRSPIARFDSGLACSGPSSGSPFAGLKVCWSEPGAAAGPPRPSPAWSNSA
jgi:hypothetical protein